MRDRDVRTALLNRLTSDHAGDLDTRIVEEMGVWSGSVRIDVAVINGELSGFELKSDRDTLDRLPFQADLYSKVFDRVTLVAGSRHASKAFDKIPGWWGRVIATSGPHGVDLLTVDESSINPGREPYLIAELLRKDEAIGVLDKYNLADGWRSKRIRQIHQRLADELPLDALTSCVRIALKRRSPWLRQPIASKLDMSVDTYLDPRL